jgi:hypothetical protein
MANEDLPGVTTREELERQRKGAAAQRRGLAHC